MRTLKRFDTMPIRWALFALLLCVVHAEDGGEASNATDTHGEETEHTEPVTAVLFPWFAEIIGVVIFFLMTRFWHAIPYTANMFLLGTFMGIGLVRLDLTDQLSQSLAQWETIDGELLLVVFLPGLLFKDAFSSNVHLVALAFSQCLMFAFPMVLAGTSLTALVAWGIFPYGWSFNLAMTLGSILSATDPVAVSALLEEVGAPPRLKVHISGESLLNDGSAMVFYTIFSALFLYELNIGLGEDIDGAEGVKIFFRMSLGGMCIGVAFGLSLLLILFLLNRRLNTEENVVQVVATITIAYLAFYVAEPVCETSGVIAVVFCGWVTKALGFDLINDVHMMESFWILVEHLLNTVLFALGGLVWGTVIANTDERDGLWTGQDWGYLFLLYVLVNVIRFFLFFSFYPINSRIGMKSNWQETFFQSYSGLRGAVGISLAIQLDDIIFRNTTDETYRSYSTKLFGMVGGIAFLTLWINGTFAGPVLKKLGLADDTKMRRRIMENYKAVYKITQLTDLIGLLADPIYRTLDFAILQYHIPYFDEVTADDIRDPAVRHKKQVSPEHYKEPYLTNVLRYLDPGANVEDGSNDLKDVDIDKKAEKPEEEGTAEAETEPQDPGQTSTSLHASPEEKPELVIELRKIFLELLRSAYHKMIDGGDLDSRQGFVTYALFEGLDLTSDHVSNGESLDDFDTTKKVYSSWTEPALRYSSKILNKLGSCFNRSKRRVHASAKSLNPRYEVIYEAVDSSIASIKAHTMAQGIFMKEFCASGTPGEAEAVVLEESKEQIRLANDVLQSNEETDVIISHIASRILLNKGARYVEHMCEVGFLKEREASEVLATLQTALLQVYACPDDHHDEETEAADKKVN